MTTALPVPVINADSAPYWAAAAADRLVIRKCLHCGQTHFMPRYLCPHCWSTELEWVDASGRGHVHTFTIMHRPADPAFADLGAYVVALIDLEEGVRMMAGIVGKDALDVAIGDAVSVTFERRGENAKVPQFKRVGR